MYYSYSTDINLVVLYFGLIHYWDKKQTTHNVTFLRLRSQVNKVTIHPVPCPPHYSFPLLPVVVFSCC